MNLPAESDTTTADIGLAWNHGFAALGADFFTELRPTPLPSPHWVGTSADVANLIGLDEAWLRSDEALNAFTGNMLLTGSRPLASVYSGHQFGVWAGQLGDGRAILLGETEAASKFSSKERVARPTPAWGTGALCCAPASANFYAARPCTGSVFRHRVLCVSPVPQRTCGVKRSRLLPW